MKKKSLQDPHAAREAAKYEHPIPSRELISEVLDKISGPAGFSQISVLLSIEDDTQLEALHRRLRAMERDGQLITNRKGEYGLTDKMDLIRGRVQGHRDGFGFVIPADGSADIFLTSRQMQKVFDGDEVLVSPGRADYKGRCEGKIIEVLIRNTHQLVGRFMSQSGNHYVRPDNPRNNHDILIPPEGSGNAVAGQFVVVEIVQFPDRKQKPVGRIAEVLGDHMAPGMEIDVAIRSYGIPQAWPLDVQEQSKNFGVEVAEEDKTKRIDLRALPFVTIDGEDARDFDDAVYCEPKTRGGWRLFVAIADVSHYVAPASALDQEAIVRGTSVYFPDFVVPMLPPVLSNGLCSLNPQVDRLCMVCEMNINPSGKITSYKFYEAVMHSHARLTYTQVGKVIQEQIDGRKVVRKQFQELLPHLDELTALYSVLRKNRDARGAIDFESKETRIIFDAERKIEKIVPVERNQAHKLIEECMLAANVCAANLLETQEIPSLYRVHEGPKEEKLELLLEFLRELGITMVASKKTPTPQDFARVLALVSGRPDAHLIQTVMLRSMNQARYQPENFGHFGLAYTAYAHFTSPIRRYPDLIVHRAIRALIRSDIATKKVKRASGFPVVPFVKNYPYSDADMKNIGDQCSTAERRADEATRDVISWLKCEYLQDRVGEVFDGVVSAVTSFGLFVELNDLYVEGLVHITALPQDYYRHEPAQHRLVGERNKRVFRIADQIRVLVARVDLDERKVDFDYVKTNAAAKTEALEEDSKPSAKRRIRKRSVKSQTASAPSSNKKSKGAVSKKNVSKKSQTKKSPSAQTKKVVKSKRRKTKTVKK